MNLTYLERQELNTLSKQILGVPSRWRTVVRKGIPDRITQIAPKAWQQYRRYLYTFDDVKAYLLEMKALQDKVKRKKTVDKVVNVAAAPAKGLKNFGRNLIDKAKGAWARRQKANAQQ